MNKILFYILLFFTATLSFAQKSDSMIDIIANKEKFHQKEVVITGYLSTEYEGTAIYFSIDDFKNRNTKNAIYVYFNQEEIVNLEKKIKNGYVQIYGTFNNQLNGHFNMFSGSLHSIKYISILGIDDIERKEKNLSKQSDLLSQIMNK